MIETMTSQAGITTKEAYENGVDDYREGMSHERVNEILGGWGEEKSSTKDVDCYQWKSKGSIILATFYRGKLTAKSQTGL